MSGGGAQGAGASVPDRAVTASQPSPSVSGRADIPSAEWRNTKRQRDALRLKFGGKCAYCGNEIGRAMHADHLKPCIRVTTDPWSRPLPAAECYMIKPERNTIANMMPACAPCNLHKGGYDLEGWRDIIQRSAAIVRRQTSTFKAGERFGIIIVNEEPVRFHFERVAECTDCADGVYPMYGVAPHECYWRKGPEFTLGQSTLLPLSADDCFVPDLEPHEGWDAFVYPSACGTFYCPRCQGDECRAAWQRLIDRIGSPPASAMSAGTAETLQAAQGDSPPARAVGDAQPPHLNPKD